MYKKIILIVLLVLSLASPAQESSSEFELDTIFERKLDEIIVDAIFDTATISIETAKSLGWKDTYLEQLGSKDMVKVEYPKIIKISKRGTDVEYYAPVVKNSSYYVSEIEFYDRDERKLNSIQPETNTEIYSSAYNKYILIGKIPAEYKPNFSGGLLYNAKGERILVMKEGPTPMSVSEKGLMGAFSLLSWDPTYKPGGPFYLYDKDGNLIKAIKDPNKEDATPFFSEFSPNGNHVVLAFDGKTGKPNYFYIILDNGEIVGRCKLTKYYFSGHSEEMAVLDDAGFAVVLDEYKIPFVLFIDWNGNIKWEQPLEIRGNMIVKISEDKSKVYVLTGLGCIWCFDIKTGVKLWYNKEGWAFDSTAGRFSWEIPRFRELKVNDDILYIIGKQGREWHSSTLFAFDGKTGNLLKKIEYPQEKITFAETVENIGIINITNPSISILK